MLVKNQDVLKTVELIETETSREDKIKLTAKGRFVNSFKVV